MYSYRVIDLLAFYIKYSSRNGDWCNEINHINVYNDVLTSCHLSIKLIIALNLDVKLGELWHG